MVRKQIGNSEIRGPNYNGQFNAPSHMLTLADIKELQETTQVGGKIKLGKFTRDFGKGFVKGFTGVVNSEPGKMIINHGLQKVMSGSGYDYNPYMDNVEHLEGGGFGSILKKAAKSKAVKGLTKAALKEATPAMSNAIAARTGLDPTLTNKLTKAAVKQVNEQVIGSGFGSILKKAAKSKAVKGLTKAALREAAPAMSNAIAARTGLDPALTNKLTKAAVKQVNEQLIGSGIGVYEKGRRKTSVFDQPIKKELILSSSGRRKTSVFDQPIKKELILSSSGPVKRTRKSTPGDKRSRRGKIVSQLMREHGMSLAQASRYIRDNNIQY